MSGRAARPRDAAAAVLRPAPPLVAPRPPGTASLAAGLAAVLGVPARALVVLGREPNARAGTYASERVRCRLPDGRVLDLFCKYGSARDDGCHGHRGSAAYEAAIYRRLAAAGVSGVPGFHGALAERGTGRVWLVLEWLGGGRVEEQPDAGRALCAAAAWAGRLHAARVPGRAPAAPAPGAVTHGGAAASAARVIRHTKRYYEGWIRRAVAFTSPLRARYPWLPELGRRADALIAPLLAAPRVFIHGELYPHNLLFRDGAVIVVDWQSAALAAGELDLATLTERWPPDIVAACEREYCRARWPDGPPPATFAPALAAARLHWLFRWLGDRPAWTLGERSRWRWHALEQAAAGLGLA